MKKLKKETITRMKPYFNPRNLMFIINHVEMLANDFDYLTTVGKFSHAGMYFYPTDFEEEPMNTEFKRGVDECPDHYKKACVTIEPRHVLKMMPFQLGNACKYILRYPYKGNQKQDLMKALDYLEWAENDNEVPFNNDCRAIIPFFNNEILDLLFEGGEVHYEGTREFINAILEDME